MGNLLTIHADVQADHLREVMAEMERLGPPRIRVVDVGDSHIAIEGSHRLAAAELLGLAPEFEVLDDDERIDVSDLDIDVLLGEADEDGTMRALDIAWTLKGSHNGEYFVGEDGRLDVVYRHIKGDWDGPARRQPTFDELVKAASDKTNADPKAAYDKLCELYPPEGILKVDGTPLTRSELDDRHVIAFDPATMRAVIGSLTEWRDGRINVHVRPIDCESLVRAHHARSIYYWCDETWTSSIDILAGHVADYLRHGGKPEDHSLLDPNDPEKPVDGLDIDWEGYDHRMEMRRDFHTKLKVAIGGRDLSYGQCLDILSTHVRRIRATIETEHMSFADLVKAVGDKDNAEWRIAYDRLVTKYPATACLEIDGTPLTENDLESENVVAFDPDTDRLVKCKIWGRLDGHQNRHIRVHDYDTFVREICDRRIDDWYCCANPDLDELVGHVADYLRHGGRYEDNSILKAEPPKKPDDATDDWDEEGEWADWASDVGYARSEFARAVKNAAGNQDLSYAQCLDVLSAKVQEIMAPKVSADIDEMVTRWTRDYNNGEADIAELADLLAEHRIDLDAVRHLLPEADGEDGCRLMDAWFRFGDGDPILITHHGDALLRDGNGNLVAVEWDVVKGRIEHALDATDSVEEVDRLESWLSSATDTTPRLAALDGPREFPPSAEVLAIIEGKSVDSVGIGR